MDTKVETILRKNLQRPDPVNRPDTKWQSRKQYEKGTDTGSEVKCK